MARIYSKILRNEAENIILEALKSHNHCPLNLFDQVLEKNYGFESSSEELAILVNDLVLLRKVIIRAYGDCKNPDSPLVALISIP